MKHIQCHKVKHLNRNNSAADCSISLKFGRNFHQATDDKLQVQGQRSNVKVKVRHSHG